MANDEAARLAALVAIWWQAIEDFTDLLEQLTPEQWATPTDLAGWDVHACASHTAHLEALLAGTPHDDVEVGEAPHAKGMMGRFTEQGVVARREASPDEVVAELRTAATARHTGLLADPPSDADAPAPGVFGAIGWSTGLLLRNRPLDVWMHEQDVRRAVGRPGNLDSPAALHSADYLAQSLGLVLAKRAGAAPGSTLVVEVDGHQPVAFEVGEDGRGRPLPEPPPDPTVSLAMDREAFCLLAGGRRAPDAVAVRAGGDRELAARILGAMAVTP